MNVVKMPYHEISYCGPDTWLQELKQLAGDEGRIVPEWQSRTCKAFPRGIAQNFMVSFI